MDRKANTLLWLVGRVSWRGVVFSGHASTLETKGGALEAWTSMTQESVRRRKTGGGGGARYSLLLWRCGKTDKRHFCAALECLIVIFGGVLNTKLL